MARGNDHHAMTPGERRGQAVGDVYWTDKVIGAAIEVHRTLGPGLLESAYKQCLMQEFEERGIPYEVEKPVPIVYKGRPILCGYRLDLLVAGCVVVELKAVEELLPIHEAQLLTYMRLAGLKTGLLLNFNVRLMREGIRRFVR